MEQVNFNSTTTTVNSCSGRRLDHYRQRSNQAPIGNRQHCRQPRNKSIRRYLCERTVTFSSRRSPPMATLSSTHVSNRPQGDINLQAGDDITIDSDRALLPIQPIIQTSGAGTIYLLANNGTDEAVDGVTDDISHRYPSERRCTGRSTRS